MIILSNLSIPGAIPASACIYTHVDQWVSLPAHYHNPHQVGSEEKNMYSTCCTRKLKLGKTGALVAFHFNCLIYASHELIQEITVLLKIFAHWSDSLLSFALYSYFYSER